MKQLFFVLFVVSAIIPYANSGDFAKTIVLGVSPTSGPVEMERLYGPLADELEQAIAMEVLFRTRNTYPEFLVAFNNEEFDIAILHPFDFLRSTVQNKYVPLVIKSRELKPIFVSTSNQITSLEDLKQKTIAFPHVKRFIYQLGIRRLQQAGLTSNDYTELPQKDFSACLQALINKSASACLTLPNFARESGINKNIAVNTIAETEAIPHVAIFIKKDLQEYVSKIKVNLLALNNSEQGRLLLHFTLFDELAELTPEALESMREHPLLND